MKAKPAVHSMGGRLTISLITVVSCLLALFSSSAMAEMDPSLIWFAAGAHGAPCNQTGRCAGSLACDPASLTCRKPAQVEVRVVNTELCTFNDTTSVYIEATNVGEISADENVEVVATLGMLFVNATCAPDGPGVFTGWSWVIYDPSASLTWWLTDTIPVQIAPGATVQLTSDLVRSLPPYTFNVTLDTVVSSDSGGFDIDYFSRSIPQGPFLDLDDDCAPIGTICAF